MTETRIPTTTPARTLASHGVLRRPRRPSSDAFDAFGIASFGPVDLNRRRRLSGSSSLRRKPGWARHRSRDPARAAGSSAPCGSTPTSTRRRSRRRAAAPRGLSSTLVYVTVGTGIGGGAIVNGETLRGLAAPRDGTHTSGSRPARHRFPRHLPVSRRLSRRARERPRNRRALRRHARPVARRTRSVRDRRQLSRPARGERDPHAVTRNASSSAAG